jgi:hypothetical protein
MGWAAARTQIPQDLCAQRIPAAQGHLLRWRSSTMPPHRLRRAAWHLPLRRSERGLLCFHQGLLEVEVCFQYYQDCRELQERCFSINRIPPVGKTDADLLVPGSERTHVSKDHSNVIRRPAVMSVVLSGVISLFADVTYEGARSITGPFLPLLGANV